MKKKNKKHIFSFKVCISIFVALLHPPIIFRNKVKKNYTNLTLSCRIDIIELIFQD